MIISQETILTTLGVMITLAAQTISLVLTLRGVIKELVAETVKVHDENVNAHSKLFERRNGVAESR